ncbi:MAG: hypothetical protein M3R21_04420 [Candidatus Dormibacteraeota bacterium]|nr:hypothetical protein [Candidatus Dormibacteraeota bacterium]
MTRPTIPLSVYVPETRYAVETLIAAMGEERAQGIALAKELSRLDARLADEYRASFAIAAEATNADDYVLGVGRGWDAYFGDETRQRSVTSRSLSAVEERIQVRLFSIRALAGSVLQLGKQGISLAYGRHQDCPSGRAVAGVPLKTVIWEGRNQAMHWEDPENIKDAMRRCFETLALRDPVFRDYEHRNMALEVVQILGWTSPEAVADDLLSLGG